MVSILIQTKDEENNLPGCLASVAWSDDIHVFDSYSTDRTVEIARAAGATVTLRRFDNFGAHQTWGLRNIPFKYPWIFYIDADERMTPELIETVKRTAGNPGEFVAFRVTRRDFFLSTWLRHVQATPLYIRLFMHEKMRYERLVHALPVPGGTVGEIPGYLDHYPFSKGIRQWLDRHNAYSSFEAQQIVSNRAAHRSFSLAGAFTAKDFNERRFNQKELFYRLPARPLVKFLLLYVGKRGFLDGRAGFTYAMLLAFYEYMIVLKTRELDAALPLIPPVEAYAEAYSEHSDSRI